MSIEYLWTFAKDYGLDSRGYEITGKENCIDIERNIWFQLRKSTWKNRSVIENNMRYVTNETQVF